MDFNLSGSFLCGTLKGFGKEAVMWAPLAIGLATNNPTILTVSEVSYAAFHLYLAYNSESRTGRLSSLTNAAISLVSPFTYHPALFSQISATTRARILMGMGSNNILRGASEIALVAKNLASGIYAKVSGDEVVQENRDAAAHILGSAFRLGLGVFRVYSGTGQIKEGLIDLSIQHVEPQEPQKIDPKNARYEFKRSSEPKKSSSTESPKVDARHAKEVFHRSNHKVHAKAKCIAKPGTHHQNDIAFYQRASGSVKVPSIYEEDRCEGTLYLRSEDTNYLHGKDNYLRAEDSRPIGEMKTEVVDALIQDGRVWYRTAEKVRDICKEIDKIHESGGKIKRLVLVGHSNEHEMVLSQKGGSERLLSPFSFFFPSASSMQQASKQDRYTLDTNVVFPTKGCLNNLEPQADIFLVGCGAGRKAFGGNLADTIARQAHGHKVSAPLMTITISEFDVKKLNRDPKFYFRDFMGLDHTYTAKVGKAK